MTIQIMINGIQRDATPQEETVILAQQSIDTNIVQAQQASADAINTKVNSFTIDTNYQALLTQLKAATSPAQINTWLTNNVTTLAQAKGVLAMLLFYIVVRDRVN